MKRFWFLVLLLAGSLAALQAPVFAQEASDSTEDVNSAIGALKASFGALESMVNNIGLYGDVRFKYSNKTQPNTNATIYDQDNMQIRARIGIKKTFGDVTGTIRMVTDANTTSTTTFNGYPNSQTPALGDGLSNIPVYFDTISLSWNPGFLNKEFTTGVGKFANILDYTPITWDDTLTLEGAYFQWTLPDTGTTLRTVYIDYDNPQIKNTTVVTSTLTQQNNGVATTIPEDAYFWTTQLAQKIKLDKDNTINLTLGYEYIPYVTALNGVISDSGKNLLTDGMVFDYGSVIPDIQMGEFLATYNGKLFADLPWKWTLHVIDNFDSPNLPEAYVLGGPLSLTAASKNTNGYSQLSDSMGYWLSVDLNNSDAPAKDAFGLQLALAYEEPNAQLSVLTDHDGGFTNTEYFRWKLGFGLENNVSLQWKGWLIAHVYYEPGITDTASTTYSSLDGATQTVEWINFFYATATF